MTLLTMAQQHLQRSLQRGTSARAAAAVMASTTSSISSNSNNACATFSSHNSNHISNINNNVTSPFQSIQRSYATGRSSFSTVQEEEDLYEYEHGPLGELFASRPAEGESYSQWLLGKHASVRRTFGAGDNAQGLLVCGGSYLAKHASFDPNYQRAQGWIRHHAVGPAVVSPVLISGLVGALVEAALPNAVPLHSSFQRVRPLIVGVEVNAEIEIISVEARGHTQNDKTSEGYLVEMKTQVERLQDGETIAEGTHSVWIPYTTTA